ncbi:conserved protein, unknown function [Plasmodium sp. gorilla clade G2]|uniref:conserved protein, unknown function n=1 Tax=Plasmodium sp. gorilla clade G2 TaxID=880535 RepID=UPI000D21CDA4|nr:conserved protein, unknown function [Plasmodium sp. gorilla clade G2]SOV16441.1 conserved protein, unknown function [Plasmodium sp. gorilla clade G2]
MCVRMHFNIDLNVLKSKYKCNKIVNDDKVKKGMINKKNYVPIIFESAENSTSKEKIINVCLWGISPFTYGKTEKDFALINARLETLHIKKSFSVLINKNRCAVIVNGYFEWMGNEGSSKKIPYYIYNGNTNNKNELTIKKEELNNVQSDNYKSENEDSDSKIKKEEDNKQGNVQVKEEVKDEIKEETKDETKDEIKDEVKDEIKEEVNEEQDEDQLVDENSHKRKKVINDETSNKKIKKELSDEVDNLNNIENNENEKKQENSSYIILAGLYTVSNDKKKECRNTIITTSSENTNLQDIHERCPLLLSENTLSLWLDVEKKYTDIIDKVKEEHIIMSSQLKFREVQNWNDFTNYTKEYKKDSILKYVKKNENN